MTELYARVPLWLSLDGGVLALDAPAQVALYRIAVGGGRASCGDDPAAALDSLCAGAGASLGRMLDLGAVQVTGGRIYLMAPDGLPSAVGAPQEPREHHAREGARTLTHAESLARLRGLFAKRGLRDAPARRAWLTTDEAVGHLARLGLSAADAARAADAAGRHGGRFGARAPVVTDGGNPVVTGSPVTSNPVVTDGGNPVVTGSPSPGPSPSEKNEETKGDAASDAGAHGGNRTRNHGGNRAVPVTSSAVVTGASTVEHISARNVTAGDALMALRGDAQLRLTVTTQQEAELERVLVDVAARGQGWTRGGVARLTMHLRAQHVATGRDGRPWVPSTSSLRGDGSWSRLLALYDEADGCPRCAEERDARRARDNAPTPPAPTPREPISAESVARMQAVRDELAAKIAARDAKPAPVTPTTETHAHG